MKHMAWWALALAVAVGIAVVALVAARTVEGLDWLEQYALMPVFGLFLALVAFGGFSRLLRRAGPLKQLFDDDDDDD